jgi:hypothetical protein
MVCSLSSDVLVYICSFMRRDENVVCLFTCCKSTKNSQFLTKVDLKQIYNQRHREQYETLVDVEKRIRYWTLLSPGRETDVSLLLPSGLHQITFDDRFNQTIDNIKFPITLKRLTFGCNFNQNIDNVEFPSSLYEITFGYKFDKNIDNVTLPATLQRLTFGYKFNRQKKADSIQSN